LPHLVIADKVSCSELRQDVMQKDDAGIPAGVLSDLRLQ